MQLIPPNTPKPFRIAAYVSIGFMSLLGAGLALTNFSHAPVSMLLNFLIFVIMGVLVAALWIYSYYFLTKIGDASMRRQCGRYYRQQGYCEEMIQCVRKAPAFASAKDHLLTLFFQLMAEQYENASKTLFILDNMDLTQRQSAMLIACKMQLYALTGHIEAAEHLFLRYGDSLAAAYAIDPELQPPYLPWEDDALMFYTLAAVLSMRQKDAKHTEQYRKLFAERLCWRGERTQNSSEQLRQHNMPTAAQKMDEVNRRTEQDISYRTRLLEVHLLYAQQSEQAYPTEMLLRAEIEMAGTSIAGGERSDYLRQLAHARIFSIPVVHSREIDLTGRNIPADVEGY